jgi:hypothetical protein
VIYYIMQTGEYVGVVVRSAHTYDGTTGAGASDHVRGEGGDKQQERREGGSRATAAKQSRQNSESRPSIDYCLTFLPSLHSNRTEVSCNCCTAVHISHETTVILRLSFKGCVSSLQ